MKLSRAYLSGVQGQLVVLAVILAGAVVLAALALLLRPIIFEPYVREKYPELPEELMDDIKANKLTDAERLKKLSARERAAVYGTLISDPDLDPHGRLAVALLAADGPGTIKKIRQTLVAGNVEQRQRAVALLAAVTDEELKADAVELCRYARERAQRRRETELAHQAEMVLRKLQSLAT